MRKLQRTLSSFFFCLGVVAIPNGCLFAQDSSSAITGGILGPVPPYPVAHPVQYPEHMLSPQYPRKALASGLEGSVELSALIGADARTKDLRVLNGDPALVSSAVKAVREWRFRPIFVKGAPVETTYRIKIRFNLLLQEAISEVELESPQETVPVYNTVQTEADPLEGEVYQLGQIGVVGPKPIYAPDPEFSEKARLAKEQGTVNLAVIVGNDGQPRRVRVACSSVPDLNENAIDTVKTWRFEPGTIGGKPVSVEIHIEVSFNLYK